MATLKGLERSGFQGAKWRTGSVKEDHPEGGTHWEGSFTDSKSAYNRTSHFVAAVALILA
jgi:hypothetical protein